MAEHVYTPPPPEAVKGVTVPSGIVIPFRPRSTAPALGPLDPADIDAAIRSVEAIPAGRLIHAANVSIGLASLVAHRGGKPAAGVVLKAFLCLARALDDAGIPAAGVIGGAA